MTDPIKTSQTDRLARSLWMGDRCPALTVSIRMERDIGY